MAAIASGAVMSIGSGSDLDLALGADAVGRRLERLRPARDQQYVIAGGGEASRERQTDALRSAGDNRQGPEPGVSRQGHRVRPATSGGARVA